MEHRERKARFDARYAEDVSHVQRFVERRVNDDQLAMDITSDVFLLLWRQDTAEEPLGRGWLLKTASHLIGNHYRRTTRKRVAEETMQILAVAEARQIPTAELLVLREAIATLTQRQRDAVALTYWDGLSAVEVAEVLGTTTAAVWTALSRAREVMRAYLTTDETREGGLTRA